MCQDNNCQVCLSRRLQVRPLLLDRLSRTSHKTHPYSSSTQVCTTNQCQKHEEKVAESSPLSKELSQKFNIQQEKARSNPAIPFLDRINQLHSHKFSLLQALVSDSHKLHQCLTDSQKVLQRLRHLKKVQTSLPSLFPLTSFYQKAILDKCFKGRNFKYQLRLIQPLQNPVFKGRNFQVKLEAVDLSGSLLNLKTLLQIFLFTCEEDPTLILNLNCTNFIRKTYYQVFIWPYNGGWSLPSKKNSNQRSFFQLPIGISNFGDYLRKEPGSLLIQCAVNKTLRYRKNYGQSQKNQVIILNMEDSSITQRLNRLASQIIERQHHVLNFGHSALSKLNQFSTSMCKYAGQDSQEQEILLSNLHRLALQQQGILGALKRIKSQLQQEKQNSRLSNTLVQSFGNFQEKEDQYVPSFRLQARLADEQPLTRLSFEKTVKPLNSNKQRLEDLEKKIDKIRDKIKIIELQQNLKKKIPSQKKSLKRPAKIRSVSMVSKKCCRA